MNVATPQWSKNANLQGVSTPQEDMDVLPFSTVVITNPSEVNPLANFAFSLTSNPQRPFRGERLVFTAFNTTSGADALDTINIVAPFFVGMVNVGAAFGQMPARVFANNSFGVRLSIPAAGQGTIISIPMVALSVPALNSLVVSGAIIGRAIR